MLEEAQGPINFTMLLTLFGDRLNGTDEENVILNAWKNFDPEATGFINTKRLITLLINKKQSICILFLLIFLVYVKFLQPKDVRMIVSDSFSVRIYFLLYLFLFQRII